MGRVVMIEPKAPDYHVFSFVRLPRLGLPQLGAILADRGHQVDIYLEDAGGINPAALVTADVVGISTTTSTAKGAYRLARFLRHHGVPVVLGGPHVTFLPEEGLESADYVVRGEAEDVFPELVERLAGGRDVRDLPGLSYTDGSRVVNNPPPSRPVDLGSLPAPDLGLIRNLGRLSLAPLLTSRGCPHSCSFCAVTPIFGRRYRFAPTDSVLEQLERNRGRSVFFYDDNFTADVERSKILLEAMIRRRLVPPHWTAQVRVDVARDRELMDLMARTNCAIAYVGLESVNPATLKAFHKGQGLEDIDRCLAELHRRGIKVHGMFIFGSDEDGPDVARRTVAYAKSRRLDTAQFLALTPLPGTALYKGFEEEGRILTTDWNLYDGQNVVHRPAGMTPQSLQQALLEAYGRFYDWPALLSRVVAGDLSTATYRAAARLLIGRWKRAHPKAGPTPARARDGARGESIDPVPESPDSPSEARLGGLVVAVRAGGTPETWQIEVRGVLDRSRFAAFKRCLVRAADRARAAGGARLVVNLTGLRLSGDVLASRVGSLLDGLARRHRELRVISPNAAFRSLLEHCRPRLPRYECL